MMSVSTSERRFEDLFGHRRGRGERLLAGMPAVGARLRARREIDRWPHFSVPEGAGGTVVEASDELLAVRFDIDLGEGASDWDNCLVITPDDYYADEDTPELTPRQMLVAQARQWLRAEEHAPEQGAR